jgi:hypothetical protein
MMDNREKKIKSGRQVVNRRSRNHRHRQQEVQGAGTRYVVAFVQVQVCTFQDVGSDTLTRFIVSKRSCEEDDATLKRVRTGSGSEFG